MPMPAKSDLFLKNLSEFLTWKKEELPGQFKYFFGLSEKFFQEWGEIWQIELWKDQQPMYFDNGVYNISPNYPTTLQIETELGKTFIPVPSKGQFAWVDKTARDFPHLLQAGKHLFAITRTKTVRRSKNEMSSLQQDPF